MKNHRNGFLRDNTILAEIEKVGVLNTEQIATLFFNKQKYGVRIAQRRLKRLYDQKRVKRDRPSLYMPYCYYIGKRPRQIEHAVMTNWAYVLFKTYMSYYEEIWCFTKEEDYGIIRPDGFIGIKDTRKNQFEFYFIEVDLSNNKFDKVKKYNTLYNTKGYLDKSWVSVATRFPAILVFTHRPNNIRWIIEEENENNLEFRVYSIDNLKEGFIYDFKRISSSSISK